MTALNPEGLKAAQAIYRSEEGEPNRVEKVIAAYLAIAHPAVAKSPEEQSRFTMPDGTAMVTILKGNSLPFARSVLAEWKAADGVDRSHYLGFKAFNIPAAIYDGEGFLSRVRERLQRWGRDQ